MRSPTSQALFLLQEKNTHPDLATPLFQKWGQVDVPRLCRLECPYSFVVGMGGVGPGLLVRFHQKEGKGVLPSFSVVKTKCLGPRCSPCFGGGVSRIPAPSRSQPRARVEPSLLLELRGGPSTGNLISWIQSWSRKPPTHTLYPHGPVQTPKESGLVFVVLLWFCQKQNRMRSLLVCSAEADAALLLCCCFCTFSHCPQGLWGPSAQPLPLCPGY